MATEGTSHSHLAYPRPTRRLDCRIGNRRERSCPGPCPPLDTYGQPTGYTPNRPAATWRRGESRNVRWHRNNHGNGESGFVRLTLVPVSSMMDKHAHYKHTFQISCWSAGLQRCPSRNVYECGNDVEGKAYQVGITVPTSYPDGVYVFGWAWYGGGDFRYRSFFGDYYSCSFVRISGGAPVAQVWRPRFVAGANQPYSDSCLSSTNRIGACPREPCNIGRVHRTRPVNLPGAIYARDLGYRATPPPQRQDSQQCLANGRTSDGRVCNANVAQQQQANSGSTALSFSVLGMMILDVDSGRKRDVSGNRFGLRMKNYPSGFTLGLRVSGRIAHIKFNVGKWSHTEFLRPFIINGNHDGRLYHFNVCRPNRVLKIYVTATGIRHSKQYMYEMTCL